MSTAGAASGGASSSSGGSSPDRNEYAGDLHVGLLEMVDAFHRAHLVPPEALRGLSAAEARVLMMAIHAEEQGAVLRPSDIARTARITPSAVSQVVKVLEGRGYVMRVRAEDDSRSVNVVLTDAGKALSRDMADSRSRLIDELIAYVGEDDMRRFLGTWRKIAEFQMESGAFVSRDESFCPPHPVPPGPFSGCLHDGALEDDSATADGPCCSRGEGAQ